MNADDIKNEFANWRSKHGRPAWKPIIGDAQSNSWFGGDPSPAPVTNWPTCAQCSKPMQFFLQLDLAALPQDFSLPTTSGILRLFYCSSDDGSCETWEPFSGTHHIAIRRENSGDVLRPTEVTPLTRRLITDWNPFSDSPHPEEHESLGLNYDYDFPNNIVSVKCNDPTLEFENLNIDLDIAESISNATNGDKLGGWPYWIQGAEYPNCPKCDATMNLVFQIDSEDNLSYMFGDIGCAHLTQCPKHPETLAFGWACG